MKKDKTKQTVQKQDKITLNIQNQISGKVQKCTVDIPEQKRMLFTTFLNSDFLGINSKMYFITLVCLKRNSSTLWFTFPEPVIYRMATRWRHRSANGLS